MSRKRYLMRFVNELLDFRLLEFNSLVEMFKLEFEFLEPPSNKVIFSTIEQGFFLILISLILAIFAARNH